MSSGQAAWADELAERAFAKHTARLQAIPVDVLADTIDKLVDHFRYLFDANTSLPRGSWHRIDEINKLLGTLK